MFYLVDTLCQSDESLALVPLTLYLASLAGTAGIERMNDLYGRKVAYLIGEGRSGGIAKVMGCFP
jgi:hypothetical protein